jgi:hypothetical protein
MSTRFVIPAAQSAGLHRDVRARGKGMRGLLPGATAAQRCVMAFVEDASLASPHCRRRTGLSASGSRGGGAGAVFVQARGLIRAGGHGVGRTNPSCAGPRGHERSAAHRP